MMSDYWFVKCVNYVNGHLVNRVTGNFNEISILYKSSLVRRLTQVNWEKSISFTFIIYRICFYRGFGIHNVIS